jgi:hypothetical protein
MKFLNLLIEKLFLFQPKCWIPVLAGINLFLNSKLRSAGMGICSRQKQPISLDKLFAGVQN